MGLISRLAARRQLRRSSRQSLETFPGWIPTPGDRSYGPMPQLGRPPRPPHTSGYGVPANPNPSVPPRPAPQREGAESLALSPQRPAVPRHERPGDAPSAATDGQQFDRLVASAAALVDEIVDHASTPTDTRPARSTQPVGAVTAAPPPAPHETATAVPTTAAAPKAPTFAAPPVDAAVDLRPSTAPAPTAAPSPEDTVQPSASLSPAGEFPPCPTWPYTRRVRQRRRRRGTP